MHGCRGRYVHSLIPAHHIPCQSGRCTHLHTVRAAISLCFFLPTQNKYRPPPTLVKLILFFHASPLHSLHFITPCTPPPHPSTLQPFSSPAPGWQLEASRSSRCQHKWGKWSAAEAAPGPLSAG